MIVVFMNLMAADFLRQSNPDKSWGREADILVIVMLRILIQHSIFLIENKIVFLVVLALTACLHIVSFLQPSCEVGQK